MTGRPADIERLTELAGWCHRIVSMKPDVGRVAIPYLHFLSAHPNTLERYQSLLQCRPPYRERVRNLLARIALWGLSLVSSARTHDGDALPDRVDVLFVSHFLRQEQAASGEDLYFGDLPAQLAAGGTGNAVALINHSRIPWRRLRKEWSRAAVPRVLLRRVLNAATERRNRVLLKSAANNLERAGRGEADPFCRAIFRHAAIDAGSPASLTALRIRHQIHQLVKRLKPRLILTTYEGHSWERLVYQASREARPGIVCVGYHHAVLFPLQEAMTRRLGNGFDPDVIVTAGDITNAYFSNQESLTGLPVRTLGSVRAAKAASKTRSPNNGRQCLVLPEGILSECLLLGLLARELGRLRPGIEFVIRLHPLFSPESVVAAESALAILPSNVRWSAAPFEEDLANSRWAVYRGSSTVITAIQSGVRPCYYRQESPELSIDPLSTLASWRGSGGSAAEIAELLDRDLVEDAAEREMAWRAARDYCDAYFVPMSPKVINDLLAQMPGEKISGETERDC